MTEQIRWLSTKEASELLGVTLRSLYRFIDEGDLVAYKFGRVIRIQQTDVEKFIRASRIAPGSLEHLYPEIKRASNCLLYTSGIRPRSRSERAFTVSGSMRKMCIRDSASPIAYSIANVPAKYRFIYDMNPLTWLLQEFQWSLVRQPLPHLWEIAASIIVPVAVFVGGAIIFEQMERGFADVI